MSTDNDLSFDEAWELEVNGEAADNTAGETDTTAGATTDHTEIESTESDTATDTSEATSDTVANEDTSSITSIEDALAHAKLWEQRFKSYEGRVNADMERRRQEELDRQKQFVEALSKQTSTTAATQSENVKPTKFQELAKDFPEIAEAVEELLSQRLSSTEELVKRAVEDRVNPIAADLSQQKVSTHLERILVKHPDAIQLRQNGVLDAWINTMPVYAQHGARYVVNSGTADEVVALLDQYKDYTNKNINNQTTDKSTTDPGARSTSPGMVEAVKAGLAVKSGRSTDPKTDVKKSPKDDYDAGWEEAIKKLGMN